MKAWWSAIYVLERKQHEPASNGEKLTETPEFAWRYSFSILRVVGIFRPHSIHPDPQATYPKMPLALGILVSAIFLGVKSAKKLHLWERANPSQSHRSLVYDVQ